MTNAGCIDGSTCSFPISVSFDHTAKSVVVYKPLATRPLTTFLNIFNFSQPKRASHKHMFLCSNTYVHLVWDCPLFFGPDISGMLRSPLGFIKVLQYALDLLMQASAPQTKICVCDNDISVSEKLGPPTHGSFLLFRARHQLFLLRRTSGYINTSQPASYSPQQLSLCL
jgi:hypothetical protein